MTAINHLTLTNRKSIAALLASILTLALVGFSGPAAAGPTGPQAPQATCPGGQCFEDVPATSLFYAYVNNLYQDGIISGYTCGTTPSEPCVAPDNRPYYRPTATVTRAQMSKFVDLGRRNIADAIGHSLYISTTAGIAVDAETRSGGEAVYAECLQAGNNCYALEGYAPNGDYAGYMYGGKGVYVESDDAGRPGLDGRAYGSTSYAVRAESAVYRGAYAKSDSNVIYSMYVDTQDGPSQGTAGLNVRGTIRGEGNLVIAGSKAGYVVDIMQNADSVALEAGDVVTIVGSSEPVLGEIPVVTVKKATSAYDTGVTGVVDQVWYAPDAATRTAYAKQEADMRAAMHQQGQATKASRGTDSKPVDVPMPAMTITDEQGTLHALPNETQANPGGYVSVVTLGAYRAIKADASYGAIKAGDLLTTSPHAGYAMKADPAQAGAGTVIGKALGSLDGGTGTLPVMVSLR
ncbi:MAG TPA: S-layer homology domain-containing protein [Chloroflexia bacterium]|jgi:hypothetical protein